MIDNAQVARNDLVLKQRSRWNIDTLSVIRYYDNSSLERDISSKENVSTDSQVIQLEYIWNSLKSIQELLDLN